MANGVQLATAYISLNVETAKIKTQVENALKGAGGSANALGARMGSSMSGGIKAHLSNVGSTLFNPIEIAGIRWASRAGVAIGSALKRSIMGVISGLSFGAIFGVGGILTAGLERLKNDQRSAVQLSLRLNPEEIKKLRAQVEEVVTGTPVALDKAMQAVTKAVNAGMTNSQAAQYIKDLADMTAASGDPTNFEALGVIMDQIRGKSKLTGEEMQQLIDRGVDVRGLLKDAFGWDDKTLENNLKRSKVGANELQKAIQKVYGSMEAGNGKTGLAQRLGQTFEGSLGILRARASKLGANFIAAIVGKQPDQDPLNDYALGVTKLSESLNGISGWVDRNRDDIHNTFVTAKDAAIEVAGAVKDITKFLKDNKSVALALAGVYASWKVVSITGKLLDNLGKIRQLTATLGMSTPKASAAAAAAADGGTAIVGGVGGGGKTGRFGKLGRLAGKGLRAIPLLGTAMIAYDLLTEIPQIRELTDKIPALFASGKDWVAKTFTSEKVSQFFDKAKQMVTDFGSTMKSKISDAWTWVTNKTTSAVNSVKTTITNGFKSAWDAVTTAFDKVVNAVSKKLSDWFGPDSFIGKALSAIGIGPATANAAATPTMTEPSSAGPSRASGGLSGRVGMPSGSIDPKGTISAGGGGDPLMGGKPGGLGFGGGASGNKPSTTNLQEPRKVGSDKGLLPETVGLKDYLTTAFPEISDVGGYRDTDYTPWGVINEHSSGKAFDIMVPKQFMDPKTGRPTPEGIAWGDRVLKEALAKGASVLWKQSQFDPDGNVSGMPDRGDNTQNHWDHLHILQGSYANYAGGGQVWGAGTATSDSIPAMLSNGEHVLTADDVKKMGGQGGVYAFRQMLQAGIIPGFAPGGPVDPNIVTDTQNQLADLTNQLAVDKAKWDEVMADPDATENDKAAATRALTRSQRLLDQLQADAPIIMSGGTPPDRSKQNRVFDATDQLDAQNRALQDLLQQEDVPPSQMLQAQYGLEQARREREAAIGDLQGQGQGTDYGSEFVRSLGFIPASAGNTGVAGTSSLAQFIGMGNDIVGGLIDTGTNLAQTAVSAAITAGLAAGTFGGGAAAAPLANAAAGYGIQLLGNTAKRLSAYGFQMAGIGADAALEIFSPFGLPRWLGYDYGAFLPQIGLQEAALSTIEKMGGDAIQKYFAGQGAGPVIPADPTAATNTAPSGPAAGSFSMQVPGPAQAQGSVGAPAPIDTSGTITLDPFGLLNPLGAGGAGGGGSWAKGGHVGIYDNGGVLRPGQLAFNASRTPESILTKEQWNAMMSSSSTQPRANAPLVENLYAQDMQDAIRQLEKVKRRDMMQYAGRS